MTTPLNLALSICPFGSLDANWKQEAGVSTEVSKSCHCKYLSGLIRSFLQARPQFPLLRRHQSKHDQKHQSSTFQERFFYCLQQNMQCEKKIYIYICSERKEDWWNDVCKYKALACIQKYPMHAGS
ncbi:hypothetical protein GOODEAATRI_031451 [Goodea atripinnis]|uniref:Uncharacterized protein n=1 Tax=Goodea atripinnis TaxID=208336 RepID=A0ABV0NS57_9TELE